MTPLGLGPLESPPNTIPTQGWVSAGCRGTAPRLRRVPSLASIAFVCYAVSVSLQGLFVFESADLSRIVGMVSIAVSFLGWLYQGLDKRGIERAFPWLLFLAVAFGSVTWCLEPEAFVADARRLALAAGVMVAFDFVECPEWDGAFILRWVSLGGAIAATMAATRFVLGDVMYSGRAGIGTKDPNFLAFGLILPLVSSLAQLVKTRTALGKLWWVLLSWMILFAVLLTGSRGGFISAVVSVAAWLWLNRSTVRMPGIATYVGLLAGLVAVMIPTLRIVNPYAAYSIHRVFTVSSGFAGGGTGRWGIFEQYVSQTAGFGFMGRGLGSTSVSFVPVNAFGLEFSPHNTFLQVGLETGVVGLTLFLCAIMFSLRHLLRLCQRKSEEGRVLLAVFIGVLVNMLVLHVAWQKEFWLFVTLVGASMGVSSTKVQVDSIRPASADGNAHWRCRSGSMRKQAGVNDAC